MKGKEVVIDILIFAVFISAVFGCFYSFYGLTGALSEGLESYKKDEGLCFDSIQAEESRRDDLGDLYCKIDGNWVLYKSEA